MQKLDFDHDEEANHLARAETKQFDLEEHAEAEPEAG